MSDWVHRYYDDVDNMRLDQYLAWHTPDVTVQFGNHPAARGLEQVGVAIGHFWQLIGGLRHHTVNLWDTGDGTTVVEALIDYTRLDGDVVTTPCVTLLHRADDAVEGGVDSVRIFIDLTPVLAPAAAGAGTAH
jgi:hypothetical protein